MNDFDTVLELRLRHLLDPVVRSQPPIRRGRVSQAQRPILTVETGGLEVAPGAIQVVEPVAVAVPVAAAHQI
jgi:hypothetical protein